MEVYRDSMIKGLSDSGISYYIDQEGHILTDYGPIKIWENRISLWTGCIGLNFSGTDAGDKILKEILKWNSIKKRNIAKYGYVPQEIADYAAKWWADELRSSYKEDQYLVHNLQRALHFKRVARFEKLLSERLQESVLNSYGVVLCVDYDPSDMLRNCWILSDPDNDFISWCRFPMKTTMKITKGRITVGSILAKESQHKVIL